jgi:amphi-Trp domain-containing protein
MSKKEVSFKGHMELGQFIEYLDALIASLKSGQLVVEYGGESVVLVPQDVVEVELEAKAKEEKEKFELEISWKKGASEVAAPADLKISAEAPPAEETPDAGAEAPPAEGEPEEA